MRKIKYFEREVTVEQYVREEALRHQGGNSVSKDELYAKCKEKGIKCKRSLSKAQCFDLLVENGVSYEELAQKIGVSSQVYQDSFGISHKDVKRLEKHGVIKISGQYEFSAFGKKQFAPLYDVYQFCRMSDDDMKKILEKYPKGKRVQK